jgi:hypothetical protein
MTMISVLKNKETMRSEESHDKAGPFMSMVHPSMQMEIMHA